MPTLQIGTRGSALALWQADRVRQLLVTEGQSSELAIIHTSGDESRATKPLMGSRKGLFTKEIEQALLDGRIDLAVHSLKDLAAKDTEGLTLAAFPERGDPRDALVSVKRWALEDLPPGSTVGTSSVRRRAAVLAARPHVTVVPLRGNVPTRISRVTEGRVDAAVLAYAGLARLGSVELAVPLDLTVMVPAPGQGALAIQVRADDLHTLEVVQKIDDKRVRTRVEAERAALAALGGDCNVPIGAVCVGRESGVVLYVRILTPNGTQSLETEEPLDSGNPGESGRRAAAKLFAAGAEELLGAARESAEAKFEETDR